MSLQEVEKLLFVDYLRQQIVVALPVLLKEVVDLQLLVNLEALLEHILGVHIKHFEMAEIFELKFEEVVVV